MEPRVIDEQGPLTNWANEPTVADLESDYNLATSWKNTEVARINDWVDMLETDGRHAIKKQPGKSGVQPKLVRKQAEWRYSALSEPFLNNQDIFSVQPKTFADREAANQNELILNYQFNNQLDKVHLIDTYVRTAVNEGTVIVRVGWDFEEKYVKEQVPTYEYSEAVDDQTIAIINRALVLREENRAAYDQLDPLVHESVMATELNGRPIRAIVSGYEEVDVLKTIKNQPNIEVCDYNNITMDPTCGGNFDKANFIVYSYESNMASLEKAGIYKNLDKVPDQQDARIDGHHIPDHEDRAFQFQDKPRQKLIVREYWGYWDINNDGTTEPIVATWVGEIMIRMEKNPYPDQKIPFVIVPYLPVKNSLYGEPDAVLLEDNQRLIGALTRGMVDAMARSANGQQGMRKDALDAVNRRKFLAGEDYEFNPSVDPRLAIIEHQYPELPASTFNMLQLFSMEAESLTGVKSFTGGLSGDALGTTATGVRGLLDAASKRELNILRRLAAGMEKIAKKVLAMNAEWLSDEEIVRITDEQFIQINRANLAGSFDVKLGISTAESDNVKAQELSFMLQTMGAMLPFDMTKIILSEIAKLRNMPDLSKTITDYQPEPDPMQQLELQKMQLEVQKLQAETQRILAEAQLKQVIAQKDSAQARKLNTEANLNDLDFVEQESGVKQERNLELMKAQAQGNLQRDFVKSLLDANTKEVKDKK